MAADAVPTRYLKAWACLNCKRPVNVTEAAWRLALDDGGRFLDTWGGTAAEWGWTACDLFNVTAGLIWRIGGCGVEAFGPEHARLADDAIIRRSGNMSAHPPHRARLERRFGETAIGRRRFPP